MSAMHCRGKDRESKSCQNIRVFMCVCVGGGGGMVELIMAWFELS